VTGGAAVGLPVLITTTSPAATGLADLANVLLTHRLADTVTAAGLAAHTGTRMVPAAAAAAAAPASAAELVARPAVPAQTLLSLSPAQFVLAVREPARRLGQLGQVVPVRLSRRGRQ